MAWNQTSSPSKKAPTRAGTSPAVKGVLALVVVWAIGSLVWWFMAANPEAKEKKVRTDGDIAEVEPAKVKEVVAPVEPEVKPIDPNARPTKVGETLNGYIKLPSGVSIA